MIAALIAAVLVVVVLIWAVMVYNGLVGLKHGVAQSWSNIDVVLKQRHDELPKLVETCKQYKQFEGETLEKVIAARGRAEGARQSGNVAAVGAAEAMLGGALGRLFAVVEAYPELKANEMFRDLQSRISALENTIADRRELYNAAVNLNNVRIDEFPDLLVARLTGFRAATLLSFDSAETADVDVKKLFAA